MYDAQRFYSGPEFISMVSAELISLGGDRFGSSCQAGKSHIDSTPIYDAMTAAAYSLVKSIKIVRAADFSAPGCA